MSPRLPRQAGAIRALAPFAALAATLSAACSDPAGIDDGHTLRSGVYVLATVPIRVLPSELTVVAETLFVASPSRYVVAGRYERRLGGDEYTVRDTATVGHDAEAGLPTVSGVAGSYPAFVTVATADSIVAVIGTPSSPTSSTTLVYRVSPPPPPPGPVASLQLNTTDTAVVLGGRIDIRPFVVRGLDASGRWIAAPSFTVVPPAGWTLDAGALVAPSYDDVGTARLVAGDVSVDVRVDAVPDLRASRWSLAWSCVEPWVANAPNLGDSAAYAMTVDSARYVPSEGQPYSGYPFMDGGYPMSRPWGQAALYAHGTQTVWRDGVATTSEWRRNFNVVSQRADAIWILPPYPDRDASGPPAPGIRFERTADAARTYVAEPGRVDIGIDRFCRALSYRETSAVRLTELPPG